jgi:hypothetical protein
VEANTPGKPVAQEVTALLSSERVILRETQRAVTPCCGVAGFITYLQKIGLVEQVRRHMPIQWKSPNHVEPTATWMAFLMTVLVGPGAFPSLVFMVLMKLT